MVDLKNKPFYLNEEQCLWVKDTLAGMSEEEKVGQLFCVNFRNGTAEEADFVFSTLKPGGGMFRPMPIEDAAALTQELRSRSHIPMLIAANLEKEAMAFWRRELFWERRLKLRQPMTRKWLAGSLLSVPEKPKASVQTGPLRRSLILMPISGTLSPTPEPLVLTLSECGVWALPIPRRCRSWG